MTGIQERSLKHDMYDRRFSSVTVHSTGMMVLLGGKFGVLLVLFLGNTDYVSCVESE